MKTATANTSCSNSRRATSRSSVFHYKDKNADAKTVVKERIYLDKTDPNVLHDDITVFDNALIRPRVSNKRYVRETRPIVWIEAICAEGNPHVHIEGENYMIGADGKLMPAKKGQKPPDLRHFSQSDGAASATSPRD